MLLLTQTNCLCLIDYVNMVHALKQTVYVDVHQCSSSPYQFFRPVKLYLN